MRNPRFVLPTATPWLGRVSMHTIRAITARQIVTFIVVSWFWNDNQQRFDECVEILRLSIWMFPCQRVLRFCRKLSHGVKNVYQLVFQSWKTYNACRKEVHNILPWNSCMRNAGKLSPCGIQISRMGQSGDISDLSRRNIDNIFNSQTSMRWILFTMWWPALEKSQVIWIINSQYNSFSESALNILLGLQSRRNSALGFM